MHNEYFLFYTWIDMLRIAFRNNKFYSLLHFQYLLCTKPALISSSLFGNTITLEKIYQLQRKTIFILKVAFLAPTFIM
jgi:hypothetical protein